MKAKESLASATLISSVKVCPKLSLIIFLIIFASNFDNQFIAQLITFAKIPQATASPAICAGVLVCGKKAEQSKFKPTAVIAIWNTFIFIILRT